jgi:hypothetical protein
MTPDWFEQLFGFAEGDYLQTQSNFAVDGTTLRSNVNGRSFTIGVLETPSLAELGDLSGRLEVSTIVGDVGQLHRDSRLKHALFQVASQFNLLEMVSPEVVPEHGITRYIYDHTQGPTCALAAAPATVFRNYLVPMAGGCGQTTERQIDCLSDIGVALGNKDQTLWRMRNGYVACTTDGLTRINHLLGSLGRVERDALRDRLRIGMHWGVQVIGGGDDHLVSQAYCSALPVAYSSLPAHRWASFATLVLEGAYEATLWAAALNAQQTGSQVVFLTALGGGAFGNEEAWIDAATRRALALVRDVRLDVRLVSWGQPSPRLERIARDFAA